MSAVIKIACHVHSDWSYDAKWSLDELADAFAERGYRAAMMSEHDRGFSQSKLLEYREACAKASSTSLLLVPGIEYSDVTNTVHVLVWGDLPFLGENMPTGELLGEVSRYGGVAVLAHPSRRQAWKSFDRAWGDHLLGVEVWNRKTDGWAPSRTARSLMRQTRLAEFVGLDFHARNQFFPLALEIAPVAALTEEVLLDRLRARAFTPTAFDSPLSRTTAGWKLGSLRLAESCRRSLASAIRRTRAKKPLKNVPATSL